MKLPINSIVDGGRRMINDVSDTNVGKMTEEEAIEIIDISPAYIGLKKISKGCSYDEWRAVNMAVEALQDQTTIRKMAEFISHMDIDEQICKKMPTVEAKECNDCQYRSYRGTDIDSCRECVVFYEDDCAYGDCVNCIIEFFRRDEE